MSNQQIFINEDKPEIPDAARPPQKVEPIVGTPLSTPPMIVSSRNAREQVKKDLNLLSEMTGKQFVM